MQPLFNKKTVKSHIEVAGPANVAKQAVLREWANTIKSGDIHNLNETQIESKFLQKIIVEVLGYSDFNDSGEWTVQPKQQISGGEVDLALGHFNKKQRKIVAPFELKGAKTKDLDAILPGRAKTTIDQAWEYANNNPGTKWVLASNYLEIRLYSYADGRVAYEPFDLRKLHEDEQYRRFFLLLGAENLLGGHTAALLEQSKREDKDISEQLYADYKKLRYDLIGAVGKAAPGIDDLEAIGVAQTILDRILFIAFAEDNGLIPDGTIARAYEDQSTFNPKPIWESFLGLFRAIDEGSDKANIPRYNGGLFSRDPVIRELELPDHICEGFKDLASYDFASEVPVTVLGRIFEQSISDIETLQKQALGEEVEEKKKGTRGRKKLHGIVYTPDYIARFIVERTIGAHLSEKFSGLLERYAAKGAKVGDDPIKWKSKKAEVETWSAYRHRIAKLRIVDPACGSGVFLVMAFDFLKAELLRVNEKLSELKGGAVVSDLYDPDSEILTNNLFGVDVNEESVEIAKLSLWIKTARRGKVLDSLDANFKVGDSLIEDSSYAYREHGFVWKDAFPEIFEEGGFDIVLGNPPYVRMELIKAMKPYLEKRFEVVADRADLYAYFFERGLKLLKPGGRLGFISSSTFFKTGSGSPLRDFLRKNATIETVVDFGDHQIFEGVTTYPAILTMRAEAPPEDHQLQFWTIGELPQDNFEAAFKERAEPYPQAALGSGSWQLESPALRALREKIVAGRPTLKEVYGSPLYGIKTGLNAAFVIDTPTKERLCRENPTSVELLKPWLEGKDLAKWRTEPRQLWIIYIPRNRVNIDDYPAIRDWLAQFRDRLEQRATKQEWFELQQGEVGSTYDFSDRKIFYPEISQGPKFSFAPAGYLPNKTVFSLFTEDAYLLALLNSKVAWYYFSLVCTALRGGQWRLLLQAIYVETLPIPDATEEQKSALSVLAERAQAAAEERYRLQQGLTRRIPDLAPEGREAKLTNRLKQWWMLSDFLAFQAEIKKAFKGEIPLKDRNDWEDLIAENRERIGELTAEIARIEDEINTRVYALFDLNEEEIALLEANL
ncbi:MAG: Eco57I restriction-modification methylase domain-containing protein [Sphingomonadaceae bacterium]